MIIVIIVLPLVVFFKPNLVAYMCFVKLIVTSSKFSSKTFQLISHNHKYDLPHVIYNK